MKKDSNAYGYYIGIAVAGLMIFVLALLGTIALGLYNSLKSNLQTIQYQIIMTSDKVWESPSSATDGLAKGFIQIDNNDAELNYLFDIVDVGTPTHIAIYGPTTSNNPKTASQFLPSDGSSLSLTVVNGGQISGSLSITRSQGSAMLNSPYLYYIEIRTAANPLGAVADYLGYVQQIFT